MNQIRPSCISPQLITYPLGGGVKQARCVTCGAQSPRTTHEPKLADWRGDHIRMAATR